MRSKVMTKTQVRNHEIEARTLVLKRLEQPIKLLKAQAEKDRSVRNERLDKLSSYKSLEEAHTLWGFDYITKEEFEEAKRFLENKEKMLNERLPSEYALDMLSEFYDHIAWEARVLAENDGVGND